MAENKEVIINVQVDTAKVAERLAEATANVKLLKEEQKLLQKAFEDGKISSENYGKAIAQNKADIEQETRAIKSNTAILQASEIQTVSNTQSLDEQRQTVNTLQKAYANLSGEDKVAADAAGGLRDQIKAATDALKEQEQAIGDARRNVGNYEESIKKAAEKSHDLADAFKVTAVGSTGLGKATDSLDKGMKLFSKNPIMGVLSLLLLLIVSLGKAIAGNEKAMAQVNAIMAQLKAAFKQFEPLIQKVAGVLTSVLTKAFDVVTKAITGVLKGIDWLAAKFGKDLHLADAFTNAGEASTEMADAVEVSNDRIVKSETKKVDELAALREQLVRRSRTDLENEIADFEAARDKELQIEGLTAEERLQIQDYYDQQIQARLDAAAKAEQDAASAAAKAAEDAEMKKLEARQKALEQFGLEPGQTPEEKELETLQQAYDTDLLTFEEYQAARTAIQERYAEQRSELEQRELEKAKVAIMARAHAFSQSFGQMGQSLSAIGDALGEFAEENEDAAKAQKGFALSGIILNQAQSISEGALAIAKGVASAAGIPFPANIPAIISIVAQVGSMIAGVTSSIAQAKQIFSQAPQFATGGTIDGNSYTGDRVLIRANSGEGVYTGKQANNILQRIANTPLSGGPDYDLLSEKMAQAVAALPAPVMVHQEFKQFEQNVSTFDELAAL